jgi:hypothetical protein
MIVKGHLKILPSIWIVMKSLWICKPHLLGCQLPCLRVGEILLIVGSDIIVLEDRLRDAAREIHESPELHALDIMQAVHTRRFYPRHLFQALIHTSLNGSMYLSHHLIDSHTAHFLLFTLIYPLSHRYSFLN